VAELGSDWTGVTALGVLIGQKWYHRFSLDYVAALGFDWTQMLIINCL